MRWIFVRNAVKYFFHRISDKTSPKNLDPGNEFCQGYITDFRIRCEIINVDLLGNILNSFRGSNSVHPDPLGPYI